jgi:hypothetical protein
MINYAWFATGYLSKDPGHFNNVQEVCFSFDEDFCSL